MALKFRNFQCDTMREEISFHVETNIFREINYLVTTLDFSRYDTFTKFLSKKCEREFLGFPLCVKMQSVKITEFYCHGFFAKISSN